MWRHFFNTQWRHGLVGHGRKRSGTYIVTSHGIHVGHGFAVPGLGGRGLKGIGHPLGKGFYGLSGHFTLNNKTILCALKGGVCAAATSCVGKRFFVCDDSSLMCCLNTTFTGTLTLKKVIYPYGFRKSKKRRSRFRNRRWKWRVDV